MVSSKAAAGVIQIMVTRRSVLPPTRVVIGATELCGDKTAAALQAPASISDKDVVNGSSTGT